MAAFGVAVVSSVAAADDLAKSLKPFRGQEGFGIGAKSLAGIESANAAMDALGTIAKQVVVEFGSAFAPVVEKVTTLLMKFGLMALDAVEGLLAQKNAVKDLATTIVQYMVKGLASGITAMVKLIDLAGDAAESLGNQGLADKLHKVSSAWDTWTRSVAEGVVDKAVEGFDFLDQATSKYDERAKKLISTQKQVNKGFVDMAAFLAGVQEEINKLMSAGSEEDAQRINDMADDLGFLKDAYDAIATETDWQALAEGTANFVDPKTLSTMKALTAQVDALIPPSALSDLDQAQLLLLDLQYAASQSERATAALAEPIAKVEQHVKDLKKANVKAIFSDFAEGAKKAASVVGSLASSVGGIVSQVMSFVGFDFSSVLGAAGSDAPAEAVKEMADAAKNIVAAVPEVIAAFVEELPGVLQAIIDGIPGVVQAVVEGIPVVVQTISDALPGLVATVVDSIPKVIDSLIANVPGLIEKIIGYLPQLVDAAAKELPILIGGILDALPGIILALVDALPKVIDSIIASIPDIVIAIVKALPDILAAITELIPTLVFSIIKSLFTELIPAIPKITKELVKSLIESMKDIALALAAAFLDAIGADKKADKLRDKTYNDTPGMVRAGPGGARVAPYDYFQAGKTPPQGGGSWSTTVQLKLGHRMLDELTTENARMPTSALRANYRRRVGHPTSR